jgi:integrase
MGRRPTKNLNLPPRMRARVRRAKTWYYYDTGGTPRREIPLGDDYPLAVRKWSELEVEHNGHAARPAQVAFRDLTSRYTRDVIPTKGHRTQKDNLSELERLKEFFGDCENIEAIQPLHVRQYLDWRTGGGKTATVRATREKALLSHIWNKAREWGYTSAGNPCEGIRGWSTGRDVYVDDATLRLVMEAACQPLRDAIDLAYLTGQRPADVRRMDEMHLRDGHLEVRQGKTGTKVRIAVAGELASVIARIRARKADARKADVGRRGAVVISTALVVNESGQAMSAAALDSRFDRVRARVVTQLEALANQVDVDQRAAISAQAAAVKQFQFRDLRAKAATDKTDRAGDIRQAQRQLGHASVTMTEKYVRPRRGEKVEPTR